MNFKTQIQERKNRDAFQYALQDLIYGFLDYQIWWSFAKSEVFLRFRRTSIGPFWITLSLAIWIGLISLIGGSIFNKNSEAVIPYMIVGMVLWSFFSTTLNEGCYSLISSEGYIKALPIKLSTHIYTNLALNFMVFSFNMIMYLFVFFYLLLSDSVSLNMLLFFPGFLVFFLNLSWMTFFFSLISARFRDFPRIVNNLIQVLFFATPIFWKSDQVDRPFFVKFNPIFHLFEIVRQPLLNGYPSLISWSVSMIFFFVGGCLTFYIFKKYYTRIPFWL